MNEVKHASAKTGIKLNQTKTKIRSRIIHILKINGQVLETPSLARLSQKIANVRKKTKEES